MKTPKYILALVLFVAMPLGLSAAEKPDLRAAFGADEIHLGGIIGERIDRTIYSNLLKINFDSPDFLTDFAPEKRVARPHNYTGLGMSLSATVRFAAYTNDPAVIALKNHLIDALIASQDADGYIGLHATPELKKRSQKFIYHELAYILEALVLDHKTFGSTKSLEAAKKLADWSITNWGTDPVAPVLWGYEGAMTDLYQVTGDPRYLDFLKNTFFPGGQLAKVWAGVIGLKGDKAVPVQPKGMHAFNYLAASMAMIDLNDFVPSPQLLLGRDGALEHLKTGGSTPPGIFTWSEGWTKSQFGRSALPNPAHPEREANRTGENCAQCYLLHFLDTLQRHEPTAWNGDVMERTIYNALFSGQSKDGRRVRYCTPVEGQRFYFPQDRMCCPNNFRRAVSKIPEWFYYAGKDFILVNLYGESEAVVNGLRLKQETAYPFGETVKLTVGPGAPRSLDLRFRIPTWAKAASAKVNGQAVGGVVPGSILSVKREWKNGDVVTLTFPMGNRWIAGHSEQAGRAVLMRGSVVYCLNPLINNIAGYTDLVGETETYDYWKILGSEKPGYAEWYKTTFGRDLPDYEASYRTLQNIRLKTETLSAPFADGTFFEHGQALTVEAEGIDKPLKLTPFADAGGRKIFFSVNDLNLAPPDELFGTP